VGPNGSDGFNDDVVFYLIVLITLAIVPVVIGWWLVVLRHLNRRSEAGIRTATSRWHVLRYGPMAPLISAAVFLGGLPSWSFSPTPDPILSSVGLPLMVMTVSGFTAFMISTALWAATSALERSIADSK
jgi:hypothetical protein